MLKDRSIYGCHETGSLGLESKVEWLNSEDSKLRREALECGSFGVLNTTAVCVIVVT
jgi:hypothetical protein